MDSDRDDGDEPVDGDSDKWTLDALYCCCCEDGCWNDEDLDDPLLNWLLVMRTDWSTRVVQQETEVAVAGGGGGPHRIRSHSM